MASVVEDAMASADWIAAALRSSGYLADFSPASLWEVERFFEENASEGQATPGGLLAASLGARIFALGAYVGEVIRRAVGGAWIGNDAAPDAEITISIVLPESSVIWPVERAMKRFKNGPEDNIAHYGAALGVPVGERPSPPPR